MNANLEWYMAWLAGNVVLGNFTLFLTFFIGIRFLIRPDTSRESTVSKGEKLDWKGVIISLFFGWPSASEPYLRYEASREK